MWDSSPSLFEAVCSNLNLLHVSIESSDAPSSLNKKSLISQLVSDVDDFFEIVFGFLGASRNFQHAHQNSLEAVLCAKLQISFIVFKIAVRGINLKSKISHRHFASPIFLSL